MATRSEAIRGFAALLRELRCAAGGPSFREMSGRSRAISHTTLHEAAQGNRLPSWETTVEFVKACGGDPEDYRDRWQAASRAVRSAGARPAPAREAGPGAEAAPEPVAEPQPAPAVEAAPEAAAEPAVETAPEPAPPAGRRLLLAIGLAAVLAVAAGAAVLATRGDGGGPPKTHPPRAAAALTPADCPVQQTNPPAAGPRHKGDAAAFIADLTLPDCSHVPRGGTVAKVWWFKNVGSVAWHGYSLHRVDVPQRRDECQTIPDVPVPDTAPGRLVDIKVQVTVPPEPGFCFVRFKMVDGSGAVAFPGHRPVNFQIIVD
jgi:hypothetical protein